MPTHALFSLFKACANESGKVDARWCAFHLRFFLFFFFKHVQTRAAKRVHSNVRAICPFSFSFLACANKSGKVGLQ